MLLFISEMNKYRTGLNASAMQRWAKIHWTGKTVSHSYTANFSQLSVTRSEMIGLWSWQKRNWQWTQFLLYYASRSHRQTVIFL